MKVLLIGGTGNISSEITKLLVYNNYDVTLVNRGIRKTVLGVKTIICDVFDKKIFKEKLQGHSFDVVIDMLCYNEENAKFLVDTFKDKIKHLIVISSTAAYSRPATSIPIEPFGSLTTSTEFLYGYNKAQAERYLEKCFNQMNITIIKPSLTFGKGCKNVGVLRQNYNIINRILNDKPLISFGDGTNPFTFSFSPDVAKGIYLTMLNEKTFGKKYTITSNYYHQFDDLYKTFAKVLNKNVKIYHLPTELLIEYNPLFYHIYYEKMYSGIYSLDDFLKDVPEFKIEYDLTKGVKMLIDYFNENKYIDESLDKIEDDLISRYQKCKEILSC